LVQVREIGRRYLPRSTGRHVDLGCGDNPRNPFDCPMLYGCDINDLSDQGHRSFTFVQGDLSKGLIFSPDNFFDSVSAFDFIEHISRQERNESGAIVYPFVSLMNEIYRILQPNGIFIASTPAFPSPAAFQDPTHVNYISEESHKYFCEGHLYAKRYGFSGSFKCIFSGWNSPKNLERADEGRVRQLFRNWNRMLRKGGLTHLTWILQAKKD
jgi:SAM-dependent methyltransferase